MVQWLCTVVTYTRRDALKRLTKDWNTVATAVDGSTDGDVHRLTPVGRRNSHDAPSSFTRTHVHTRAWLVFHHDARDRSISRVLFPVCRRGSRRRSLLINNCSVRRETIVTDHRVYRYIREQFVLLDGTAGEPRDWMPNSNSNYY